MSRERVVANKRLGQNFLHDPYVIRRVVSSLELAGTDTVLEIGCGTGALTQHIASGPHQFIGVELDRGLFKNLCDRYRYPSALFLNQDILQLQISELISALDRPCTKVKVVGNLPYYISSPIIKWLGEQSGSIESATIMLQAEVADRLVALPGRKEFGVLSLLASYHFDMDKVMNVRPDAFRPIPRVSSKVLRLRPKLHPKLDLAEETALFSLIKQSFSHRRKTLLNCLKGSVNKVELEAALVRIGHHPASRAEALSLQDFITLCQRLRFKDCR